jgi:hypothetical protein
MANLRLNHILCQVESLEVALGLHGAHDVLGLKPNLVILQSQDSQATLIVKHLRESINSIIINLIVVKVKFLKRFIVNHSFAQANKAKVSD